MMVRIKVVRVRHTPAAVPHTNTMVRRSPGVTASYLGRRASGSPVGVGSQGQVAVPL